MAHLHMRDDEGKGTMDKNRFAKTVELLRTNHPDCRSEEHTSELQSRI